MAPNHPRSPPGEQDNDEPRMITYSDHTAIIDADGTKHTFEEGAQILADGGGPSDVDYQGVSGPIDFDENGDPKGFLQVLEVQDHSYKGIDFISG